MELITLGLEWLPHLKVRYVNSIFSKKNLRWKREIIISFDREPLDIDKANYIIKEMKKNKYFIGMKKIRSLSYPCIFFFDHPEDQIID